MPDSSELNTLFYDVLDFFKKTFSGTRNLDEQAASSIKAKLLAECQKRLTVFLLFLSVFEVGKLIWMAASGSHPYYFQFYYLLNIVMFIVSVSFLFFLVTNAKRKNFFADNRGAFFLSFWIIFSVATLVSSFFSLVESGSIIHYTVLCIALAVIPLFSPTEAIVITAFNFTFELFIILATDSEPFLILQCAALSVAAVFISQMLTSGFIAFESANDRIKEADNTLECLAQTDKLTGLLNRHGLEECLDVLWPQCMRENTNVLIAGVKVDFLKEIYEKSGDEVGNDCVKKVAKVLRANCKRSTDIVARYDNDHFAIFITGIKNDNIVAFMEKIRGAVESAQIPAADISASEHVTVSIGVVSDIPTQTNCETLFAIATEELENAEECGFNCISYNNVIY